MIGRSAAGGGIVELPGFALARSISSRTLFAGSDALTASAWDDGHQRDGGEVLHGVERQLRVEPGAGGVARVGHEQRVAVGCGLRDDLGSDVATGAATVVDHHRLAQRLGELLSDDARGDVGAAAGGEGDHHADGLRRVALRVCDSGREHECGGERRRDAGHGGSPPSLFCAGQCSGFGLRREIGAPAHAEIDRAPRGHYRCAFPESRDPPKEHNDGPQQQTHPQGQNIPASPTARAVRTRPAQPSPPRRPRRPRAGRASAGCRAGRPGPRRFSTSGEMSGDGSRAIAAGPFARRSRKTSSPVAEGRSKSRQSRLRSACMNKKPRSRGAFLLGIATAR